jgi:uncharacterized protein (DUF1499 family)
MGFLGGSRPKNLGLQNGSLAGPKVGYQNSISTETPTGEQYAYHKIAPLKFLGDPDLALQKLRTAVESLPGSKLIKSEGYYLYYEFETQLLKFIDDVEFLLDEKTGTIQMRSASRLGRKDLGANRTRLEKIRSLF